MIGTTCIKNIFGRQISVLKPVIINIEKLISFFLSYLSTSHIRMNLKYMFFKVSSQNYHNSISPCFFTNILLGKCYYGPPSKGGLRCTIYICCWIHLTYSHRIHSITHLTIHFPTPFLPRFVSLAATTTIFAPLLFELMTTTLSQ